jgi:hypothetical protein
MPGLQNILLLCHDKATKFLSINFNEILRKLLCTYSAIILLIKLHIEDEAKMISNHSNYFTIFPQFRLIQTGIMPEFKFACSNLLR